MRTTLNLVNYYMTQFYDHDSAEENQAVKKEDFHLGDSNDPDEVKVYNMEVTLKARIQG